VAADPVLDNIGEDELAAALRVLERVAADRGVLASASREARERLQRLAGEIARPDLKQRKKLQKELARKEREDTKAHDTALRDATGIRSLRKAPLFPTPLPPLPPPGVDAASWTPPLEPAATASASTHGTRPALKEARKCYVCKRSYTQLHHFYDQMCADCGALNFERRTATADLRGRTALITGARVKIGYQGAILLLRAGCDVVVLTRFPRDAAQRYAREADFSEWKDRLTIYGVDLRHTPSVEQLASHLERTLPRLDFQVHNACQTVRRPPGFYTHLVEAEHAALSSVPLEQRKLLQAYEDMRHHAPIGAKAPALLTQAASDADRVLGDGAHGMDAHAAIFPAGALDQDLQQIDLRTHNSWRLTLGEVPTLELLEVMLVNATAPFVFASKLRALMHRSTPAPANTATSHDDARHIVMVSAMEGQFYREHKTEKHPHTNMAKAALNMAVRTSAPDLARDRIYMNAVDTGWVTDEDPAHLAERKAEEHAFSPPLDIVDGAARIIDPIFSGFKTGAHRYGLFLKDYIAVPW
jgi:NAD(P)-dependent dehydrogenase (short-subunit alcohol dehydrogenase family)